jgi:hypothetical protein
MMTLPLGCVDNIREAKQCSCYTAYKLEEKLKIRTSKTIILQTVLYWCKTWSLTSREGYVLWHVYFGTFHRLVLVNTKVSEADSASVVRWEHETYSNWVNYIVKITIIRPQGIMLMPSPEEDSETNSKCCGSWPKWDDEIRPTHIPVNKLTSVTPQKTLYAMPWPVGLLSYSRNSHRIQEHYNVINLTATQDG